ncbi:MAG: hypothetical protein JNK14_16580 [Chitinophagaceae bacterium]|nr:hypothetical protein [Chitinophagaceae bacterium]
MRTAALTLFCIVAFGYAMNAQRFSLLPQVGFENSKTKISYNDLPSFAPGGVKFTPQASLRLNYSSKPGHGFFLGAATSRSVVQFSFADPETGMNNFAATTGNLQLRLEGGYQFRSKPISLSRTKQPATKTRSETKKKGCSSYTQKSSCSKSYSSSRCGGSSNRSTQPALAKNKGSWMRIIPSAGMGFIPAVRKDVVTKTQSGVTSYEYRAGNWQTGLIAGTSFEFGNRNTPKLTVSINYFKGIGNLNTQTIISSDNIKSTTTTLQSSVSGWNLRAGIPFSLAKKPASKNKIAKKMAERKTNCQEYRIIRYRCVGN